MSYRVEIAAPTFARPGGQTSKTLWVVLGVVAVVVALGTAAAAVIWRVVASGSRALTFSTIGLGQSLGERFSDGSTAVFGLRDGSIVVRRLAAPSDPSGPVSITAEEEIELARLQAGQLLLDLAVGPGGRHVYLSIAEDGRCEPTVVRVDVATGRRDRIADGFGVHVTERTTLFAEPVIRGCEPQQARAEDVARVLASERLVVMNNNRVTARIDLQTMRIAEATHPARWSGSARQLAVLDDRLYVFNAEDLVAGGRGTAAEVSVRAGRPVRGPEGEAISTFNFAGDRFLVAAIGSLWHLARFDDEGNMSNPSPVGPEFTTLPVLVDARVVARSEPPLPELLWVDVEGTAHWWWTGTLNVVVGEEVIDAAWVPLVGAADAPGSQPFDELPAPATAPPPIPVPPRASTPEALTRLGGRSNHLGWADTTPGASWDSYILAVNGQCTNQAQGDRYLSSHFSGRSSQGCEGTPNADHRPQGYEFVISVPADHGRIDVMILDPMGPAMENGRTLLPPTPGRRPVELSWSCGRCRDLWTTFSLRGPDGTSLAEQRFGPKSWIDVQRHWNSGSLPTAVLGTIEASAPPGDYIVTVATNDTGNASNHFGLLAAVDGVVQPCDPGSNPRCPRVFARSSMSVAVMSSADIPLLRPPADAVGSRLEIDLFDLDYPTSLQLIGPDGGVAPMAWSLLGDDSARGEGRIEIEPGRLNARVVRIQAPIDAADGWYRLSYGSFGADAPTDQQTLEVRVVPPADEDP